VYGDFDRVTAYVKQHDRRIYLGEFGAVDKIDEVSRETYIRMVRTEAERRGLGWAYWDDGGMNRGMNVHTGEWVPVIQRALFND
jgi:endoglucanase